MIQHIIIRCVDGLLYSLLLQIMMMTAVKCRRVAHVLAPLGT